MQTQSISLVTTAVSQNVSTKTTKANGDTFERFMSDHGTKLTEKKGTDANTVNTDRANKDDVRCDLNKNKDVVKSDKGDLQLSDNKVDCTGNGQTGKETKTLEDESVQAVTEQIVTVIAQVLQVPVEQVQDILTCDLLAIDDLGSEPMMRGVTVGSIYHVISERHNASRPMILSTNCSVQQLYEKYEDRIAARLCDQSRMTIIEFIGEDVRRFAH